MNEENRIKESIKLSVIIPVYNTEKYLKRCVDSVLSQTYKNLDIILVDDGSTDGGGRICDRYAEVDTRVRVYHQENGGVASASKVGASHAIGEYVILLGSDDWIEADGYELMMKRVEEYHPDIVAIGYKKEFAGFIEECGQVIADGFYEREDFWNAFEEKVDEAPFFCQPIDMSLANKAIKTELWKKHQLNCSNDLKKNVDDAVVFPCLLEMNSIYVESAYFVHYCVRKTSVTWEAKKGDYERFLCLADSLLSSMENSSQKTDVGKKFLIYKLFYHLILDVPEKLIDSEKCMIYPQVKPGSNIIVYGKGVFANRFMARIKEMDYCSIVENIDKSDADRLLEINEKQYDYIVIAAFHSAIVTDAMGVLAKLGIAREKVLCMEKENMTTDLLPPEAGKLWENMSGREISKV